MNSLVRNGAVGLLALLATGAADAASAPAASGPATSTPIKHVVVIFQENISFDHYFATYPRSANPAGEPRFVAAPGTPTVNGLNEALLTRNPNKVQPFRLGRAQAPTCDMDHEYRDEQRAFDGGLMDKFVEYTSNEGRNCTPGGVMAYFDGNTATAMWNYAQHFAMSDNSFDTVFGPSTPGAIDLISGQTHGAMPADYTLRGEVITAQGTVIGDPDPQFDDCSDPRAGLIAMRGQTVGDLLDAKSLTWGWFEGGFKPTETKDGKAVCGAKSTNITGASLTDYSPHHQPFQYYQQTANPHHLPPSSVAMIGRKDQANHQYDLSDFYAAMAAGHMPAVSFIKAKKVGDGHAGQTYSNPIDEQTFLVGIINAIQRSPDWKSTAIIIAYDDSDGWYDHVMPPVLIGSSIPGVDALNGDGKCGPTPAAGAYQGRCGYGARLPLMVVSPFARVNFVDHALTDQTSVLRFIEDNWSLGRIGDQSYDSLAGTLEGMFDFTRPHAGPLILDPATGNRPAAAPKKSSARKAP